MRRISIVAFCLLIAGCQGYEPWRLDPDGHRADWESRSPLSADVARFAQDLAARSPDIGVYDPKDGVELGEAEIICLFFNGELRAARLEADIALAGAREAGAWENPTFEVSAGRVLESISQPWILAAGISFTIPLSGRPGVERDVAYAKHRVSWRQVLEKEWAAVAHLRALWREHAATLRHEALLADHLKSVDAIALTAERLVKAGGLDAAEGRLAAIEQALSRARLADMRRLLNEQRLGLKGWLGLSPGAPIDFKPNLAVANPNIPSTLDDARSPAIAVKRAEYRVAEENLRLEIHKQYPDLSIGPSFESEEGQSKIFLGLGLPIPLLNLNKQGIAEARAARAAARAAFDARCEQWYGDLAMARMHLDRAAALRRDLEQNLAPLVDLQVEQTRARAELGEFDALLTLEALKSRLEAKERILDAALDEARAADALSILAGPPHVQTDPPQENKR